MAIQVGGVTVVDNSRNLTNVANATISGTATFSGTGAIQLPSGTTAQQPGSPSAGMLRYNTETTKIEFYNGTAFTAAGGGGATGPGFTYFIAARR